MQDQDAMLARYMQDISVYPRIKPPREKELADIIQKGDDPHEVAKAKDELVLSNLKLVVKFAIGYYPKVQGMNDANLSLMDLINEGNIGLMRAADLFKSSVGTNFSTYAYLSIQRRVKMAIKQGRFMRLPLNHFKYIVKLKALEDEYEGLKIELTDEIILKKLAISAELLELVRKNRACKLSLEGIEEALGGDKPCIENADDALPADEDASQRELRDYLYEKMKELKPNERDVLFMRFFGNQEMTLEEIGQRQGLTKERIRQILGKGLKSLKIKIQEEVAHTRLHGSNKDAPVWEIVGKKNIKTKKKTKKKTKSRKHKDEKENTEDSNISQSGKDKKPRSYRTYKSTKNLPFIKAIRNNGCDFSKWGTEEFTKLFDKDDDIDKDEEV